ncbi:Xaa-His dipeptidase [Clostridium intestinale]|uniref:Xaa-His dipeptidase n=1 Tax=Clostridium intestinale TaxID=36845 RepID=A0A7D7AHB9_9CLOT|nr:Xaa-His dipeptidase [Clostridium intestinale]QLY82244.1 Xaa-His dipeptidase [Clostridium intestinale]
MGRRSVDELIESNINVVISMLKDGCKDKEIIEFLGISRSAWKAKKNNNIKLRQAIEETNDEKNEKVEEALFKNCIGYKYYEEVATKVKEEIIAEDGTVLTKEDVKVVTVKKYKGPDLAAQKYWLNNKKKAAWKEDPHKAENDRKLTKLKEKEVNSRVIE